VLHPWAARLTSAAAIGLAAAANVRGVRLGAAIVTASTAAKFGALLMLVAAAAVLGGTHGGSIQHLTAAPAATIAAGGIGAALVSIFWTYDGWGDVSFAAGEVDDPGRTLPRAIIAGTLGIIVIYLAANSAYLYVNSIDGIARSPLIAAETMQILFGSIGAAVVSVFVTISSFSSLNGSMLAAPRVFYAMAADGLFFPVMAREHATYRTPYVAIIFSAVLGTALVASQTFERLTSTFVLAIWPFYALSVAAIYRLRARRPDLARPYLARGYPWIPAVFIASVIWFVADAIATDPAPTLTTFALILAGVPVYIAAFGARRSS